MPTSGSEKFGKEHHGGLINDYTGEEIEPEDAEENEGSLADTEGRTGRKGK